MADLSTPHRAARAGLPSYGFVAGIIMLDSTTPRVPGDPGHAATFAYPVLYEIAHGFTIKNLLYYNADTLTPVVAAARHLQAAGVHFVTTDCGLFSLYQAEIAAALAVPFVGSSLAAIPFLLSTLSPTSKVGIITGHADYLTPQHLAACGIDPRRVAIVGMENGPEFAKVVLQGGSTLDPDALSREVVNAASHLAAEEPLIAAWILECTNLSIARPNLLLEFGRPVFDLLGVIEMLAEAYRLRTFTSDFLPYRPRPTALEDPGREA